MLEFKIPFTPFIDEHLWGHLGTGLTLLLNDYTSTCSPSCTTTMILYVVRGRKSENEPWYNNRQCPMYACLTVYSIWLCNQRFLCLVAPLVY